MSTLRIIHTADNHIGLKFSDSAYSDDFRNALLNERLQALERIVEASNTYQADLLMVAGDLFDTTRVADSLVKQTAAILKGATSVAAIVVLPGNHDFYEEGDKKLWAKFANFMQGSPFHLLSELQPETLEFDDKQVILYPGACRSKHSLSNTIGWMREVPKPAGAWHIGIAHGSVEGVSPDDQGTYYPMTRAELQTAGVDAWLLGHTHSAYPQTLNDPRPPFFFSATHTPDGFRCKHGGSCWLIELDEAKKITYRQLSTGKYRFYHVDKKIRSQGEAMRLLEEFSAEERSRAAIKLRVSGRLPKAEMLVVKQQILPALHQGVGYLHIDDSGLAIDIDADYINQEYPTDSLPHRLLTLLAADPEDTLALQLANTLVERTKSVR